MQITSLSRREAVKTMGGLGLFGLLRPLGAPSPVATEEPTEEMTLIPYGATTLRIAELPEIRG